MSAVGSDQKGTVPISLLFNCFWHVMKEIEQQRKAFWKKIYKKKKKLNLFTFQILWGERKGWILPCYLLPRHTKKVRKISLFSSHFFLFLTVQSCTKAQHKGLRSTLMPCLLRQHCGKALKLWLMSVHQGDTGENTTYLTEKPPNIKSKTHKYSR